MTNEECYFCVLYAQGTSLENAIAQSNVDLSDCSSALEKGYQLLNRDDIQELIAEKRKSSIATNDEILAYLTNVMRGTSESEENIVLMERGKQRIQKEIKKPSEKERLQATRLLMESLQQNTTSDFVPVEFVDMPTQSLENEKGVYIGGEPIHDYEEETANENED